MRMVARLHLVSRFVLGAVFVLSGILKLFSPHQAAELLSEISSLDPEMCKYLVVALSLFEIMLGTMLLVGKRYLQLTALISAVMLLFFTFLGVATIQDPRSCGCFGDLVEFKTDEYLVLRNVVLFLVSLWVLRYSRGPIQGGSGRV